MLNLACGSCGLSILSNALPPFGWWCLLLPVAFVVHHIILAKEGKYKTGILIGNILGAGLAFVAAVVMLAVFIAPVAFLFVFVTFFSKLFSTNKTVRKLAGGVLAAYLITGIVTFAQARSQGDVWKLSRIQAGSPGMSFTRNAAQQNLFSDQQLLELVQSEDSTVSRNALDIASKRIQMGKDWKVTQSFYEKLNELDKNGKLPISDYRSDFQRSYRERLATETPATQEANKSSATEETEP